MRLESGATGAQPNTRPARLPKDIEDQIAVVRGRAVGKPSRGLLQLEERLLRTHDMEPTPPVIQRYEHHATPLRVSAAPASQARALALPAPMAGSAFGGRFNVESFEDASTAAPTIPADLFAAVRASAGTVPWASEQSNRGTRQRALTQDQQAVATNFERDLAAMVGSNAPTTTAPEDQQWDDALRSVTNAPPATSAPAAAAPEAPPAPKRDAHEVFHQMGLAMNYANSFDLGAVDLSARFDQFDNELALAPKTASAASAPVPVQALALDDFDLIADLAEISGAQSAATPTAAAPATQPTTNPEQVTAPAT